LWAKEFTRRNNNSEFSNTSEIEEFKSNNKFEAVGVAGGPNTCSWGPQLVQFRAPTGVAGDPNWCSSGPQLVQFGPPINFFYCFLL
jgi:hypothetical protein